jgi:hypothetical protein
MNYSNFKYVVDIDSLSEKDLNAQGYYTGFPCVHNHVIRNTTNHWCYHCVEKIISNNCGFNINFLHADYRYKFLRLWDQVDIGNWEECWTYKECGNTKVKRVQFPSYRSFYQGQKSENVSAHKVIYQCAWGDVGNLFVTHLCGNKHCLNPLHLMSSWNRASPPANINPFQITFDADALLLFGKTKFQNNIQSLFKKDMRSTITHPLDVTENPEYNE